MKGPVYMNSKAYLSYFKEKVDHEGVPLEAPDDTPVGPKLRPHRRVYSTRLKLMSF
jgi:hypothetical protein